MMRRFGTRTELFDLVEAAHARGLRIVLDVILNHSGDNWGYVPPDATPEQLRNQPPILGWPNFYGNALDSSFSSWTVAFRDEQERGVPAPGPRLHDAVWPVEFRDVDRYTRAGLGRLGEGHIEDPHAENKRTDFFALKDLALDTRDTLQALVDCYKYWIAVTDCDGFRIDTVKHMALEETRNFCGAIREFTDRLDKRNFLIVGEIAGGDFFQDYVLDNLAILRRNMSAALDIGSARLILQGVAKGLQPAGDYFDEFREAMFGPAHPRATHASALRTQLPETDASLPGFGPFGTVGEHAFDRASPAYVRIAALCAARARHPALRIGRQYARETRVFAPEFRPPPAGELVAWSRLLDTTEAVVVVNPNGEAPRGGDVVVSASFPRRATSTRSSPTPRRLVPRARSRDRIASERDCGRVDGSIPRNPLPFDRPAAAGGNDRPGEGLGERACGAVQRKSASLNWRLKPRTRGSISITRLQVTRGRSPGAAPVGRATRRCWPGRKASRMSALCKSTVNGGAPGASGS